MPRSEKSELKLAECERILQYKFRDRSLLQQSLTHASSAISRLQSNERLEFLGDAFLGAIVCEMLYHKYPSFDEGDLTKLKSSLVSRNTCAIIGQKLELGRFLFLGNGLLKRGGIPNSILAGAIEAIVAAVCFDSGAIEAIVAAVCFDGGLEAARTLVEQWMAEPLEILLQSKCEENFKSLLQQISQRSTGETPVYKLIEEQGPDHNKMFHMAAAIGDRVFESAWGASKKEAEQAAAKLALEIVEVEENAEVAKKP